MLTQLQSWLAAIPGTFWGVVAGSFFTLIGVFLTNRAQDRRQAATHAHEQSLKAKERKLDLRRQIYLDMVEYFQTGVVALGRMSDLTIPPNQISSEFSAKSVALAKGHLVADAETARAVADLGRGLQQAMLELNLKRGPLLQKHNLLKIVEGQMKQFGAERDRWVEQMKQANLAGAVDKHRWDALNRNYEFEQKRSVEAVAKHSALAKELHKDLMVFVQDIQREAINLNPRMLATIVAVRKELDMTIDADEYRRLIGESTAQSVATFQDFLKRAADLAGIPREQVTVPHTPQVHLPEAPQAESDAQTPKAPSVMPPG